MVHLTAVLNREYGDRELESLKADIMAFMPYDDLIEKTGGDLDFLDEAILDLASSNGWDIEDAGADAIEAMEAICQKIQTLNQKTLHSAELERLGRQMSEAIEDLGRE